MGKGSNKKPSPEKPDWKKLEEVVAKVQIFLKPDAQVQQNYHVIGKAGRRRQLDVTVSQINDGVPSFIVFECKRYSRPVGIEKVEAFATKLEDVSATLGVMISSKGFDAGAKAMAAYKNIILKTYREADETDWKNYMGRDSWSIIIRYEYDISNTTVILENGKQFADIPHNLILFNKDGGYYREDKGEPWTVVELFLDGWKKVERPRAIGKVQLTLGRPNPPIFVRFHGNILPTDCFIINAMMIPKKYPVNIKIDKSELLENSATNKLEYIKAITREFNAGEIMATQAGVPFTKDEWDLTEKTHAEIDIDIEGPGYLYLEASMK